MTLTILNTDHYKFTMAEAGWPLRREIFYYTHRKGGPHYIPFDFRLVGKLFESCVNITGTLKWLESNGTPLGTWFSHFAANVNDYKLTVSAVPARSWVQDGEPFFVVSGPSFLVSFLEPTILQLNYRIQLATLAINDFDSLKQEVRKVTCQEQKDIIIETLTGEYMPGHIRKAAESLEIDVCEDEYFNEVKNKVKALIEVVDDPARIFEVGYRSATCTEQHVITLKACKEAGLLATSHASIAAYLNMKSVGTMGHEHVQRFGSDKAAFKAMVERIPGSVFFLLDTFDTYASGLPAAYDLIQKY